DDEVALGGRRRPDVNGAVGHFHMEGVFVGVGIDRDALYPHAPRGLDDATCDFAAIGDQNALEHAVQYPEMPAYWALRSRQAIVNATLAGRTCLARTRHEIMATGWSVAHRAAALMNGPSVRLRPPRARNMGNDPLQDFGIDVGVVGPRPR